MEIKWNKLNIVIYYYLALIIYCYLFIYCYFLYNVSIILCFIPSLQIVFIHVERHKRRQNRWVNMVNSTHLAEKIECAQYTVQDCARLPCKIARWLLCNIATCRIPCKVLHVSNVFKNNSK